MLITLKFTVHKNIDKLQFLSFTFAVLLSITAHFIALRLGRKIMHQHTKIMHK